MCILCSSGYATCIDDIWYYNSILRRRCIIQKSCFKTLILISVLLLSTIPLVAGLDYQIDGDKVYIDDENAYLSVQPATLGSSGWITVEVESKKISTNFDFGFGYDKDKMHPTKAEVWLNYTHPKRVLQQVNITPNENSTSTIAYEWVYINETYEDWKQISGVFTKYTFNYQGFDTWYVSPSVFLTKNIRYKIRIYMEINFEGLNQSTGKYFVGIKPSAETIQQAITNNHFYYIDPWWDTSWERRVLISIDDTFIGDQLKNFPVLVWINSSITSFIQADGDDIRFVALDNTTLYNFEIENISATDGILCWVNISTVYMSGDGDTSFWLYYCNAGASNGQNPTGVWDGYYQAVWHMNSTICWDSTINHYSATTTDSDPAVVVNGTIGNALHFDGNDGFRFGDILDIDSNVFTLEAWILPYTVDATNRRILSKYDATGYSFNVGSSSNRNLYMELWDGANDLLPNTGITSNTNLKNGSWHYAWAKTYGSTKVGNVSFDKLFYGGQTLANMGALTNAYQFAIAEQHAASNQWIGLIDEVRVSIGICRNESWLNASFDNRNNSAFLIWSLTETYSAPSYCTIEVGYMFNGTTEVNPCCINLGLNITNSMGLPVNVSFFVYDINTTNAWIKISTISYIFNGSYFVCVNNISIAYNKTYYWYGNVTNQTGMGNNTGILEFTTDTYPCNISGGGSGYSIISHDNEIGLLGLFGILGIIGFVLWRRRR